MPEIKILGIAGSLRKNSYNRAALRSAQELVPAGATLEIFTLNNIPLFNQDERVVSMLINSFQTNLLRSQ